FVQGDNQCVFAQDDAHRRRRVARTLMLKIANRAGNLLLDGSVLLVVTLIAVESCCIFVHSSESPLSARQCGKRRSLSAVTSWFCKASPTRLLVIIYTGCSADGFGYRRLATGIL